MRRAVLLDALGTLVELRPPAPALRLALIELAGVDVGEESAERAFRAEIAHYLEHHLEGADPHSLERLRDDCAAVMHEALGLPEIPRTAVRRAMLESLDFVPFPDAVPALTDLRRAGVSVVAVSNWDCSLPLWLDRAGLLAFLDGAVSSAVVGEAKPSPRPFAVALELVRAEAGEALHVGDSERADVRGAEAAGITPVLIDRLGGPRPAGVRVVRSLAEVPSLI